MIIISKERNEAYNWDIAERIYIAPDKSAVKIVVGNTRAGNLGEYGSFEKAKKALEIIMADISLGRKKVAYMPDDAMVQAKISENKEHYHHATGKKIKGHGGS